jgi:hypothetical protein
MVVPAAIEIWPRARQRRPRWRRPEGVADAIGLAIGLAVCVGVATVTNARLGGAVQATVADSLSFTKAIEQAHQSVAVAARETPAPAATVPAPRVAAPSASPSAPPATPRIAALDARLSSEGSRNTISARTLFLERAMLVYRSNGPWGMGLEAAQPLAPHNTFVLFALAFGYVGWLIPLTLVALALFAAHDARDLPLAVAAIGTMATSHDILLTPSLFLPIALGIGGMIAGRTATGREPRVRRSIAFGALIGVILFALGCLVILLRSPSLTVERLSPGTITAYRGVYLVHLPMQTFPGVFVPAVGLGTESPATFLREDSQPLTRVVWRSGVNPATARGAFAIQDDLLIFAPADGGDPRTGGHVIELGLPHQVGPALAALLLVLAAWGAGVVALLGRRDARGVVNLRT